MNNKGLKSCVICMMILIFQIPVQAKTDRLKDERVHLINLCHIGVGFDIDAQNYGSYSPILQFRFGHEHELFNYALDVGKSICYGPRKVTPVISSSTFFIGATFRENLWNYHDITLCLSERLWYNWPVDAEYKYGDDIISDSSLTNNHLSAGIKLSILFKCMEIGLFYTGTINSMYDQKYIYESYIYDYQACRDQINSRSSVGLSIMFHIDL